LLYIDDKMLNKMTSKFIIRSAKEDDALSIFSIRDEVIGESYYLLPTPQEHVFIEEEARSHIRSYQNNSSSILLVAEDNQKIIGVLEFDGAQYERLKHSGDIDIYIQQEYKDMGVGKQLMERLFDWVAKHPYIEIINLKVHATNARAIHFYKKMGFEIDGVKKRGLKYSDEEYIDIVSMNITFKRIERSL
jgi:RimJ/RimL family protein N-acetyltransferase